MLAFGLTLTLLALPSAQLVGDEAVLSAADVLALDREVRILNANIQELRPHLPNGSVVGMALGFSFAVLLFPGIPVMIAASVSRLASTTALLALGGVLTGLGGLGLLVALICLVLGNNAESEMAEERAQLVEKRDAVVRRLAPYQQAPTPRQQPIPIPGYVPGVQLAVPMIHLARF